jgi:hypothetical protein
MESRTVLSIITVFLVATALSMGALLVYYHFGAPSEAVAMDAIPLQEAPELANPWSLQGDAAVALVRRKVRKKNNEDLKTVGELLATDWPKKTLGLRGEKKGWTAVWWGETSFGPSYFLVRHVIQDDAVDLGPAWLVDLKTQRVVAKNQEARLVESSTPEIVRSYRDKEREIITMVSQHRFTGGISLAGAILLYFENRKSTSETSSITGWTISHDQKSIYLASFQWKEGDRTQYAAFEFDYEKKALKASNLQAGEIIRVGESFDRSRVDIMPRQYNPKARRAGNRWKGAAKKACNKPRNRSRCEAFASLLAESGIIESLEWLLTARVGSASAFDLCKEDRRCKWIPKVSDKGGFTVSYHYQIGSAPEVTISWSVGLNPTKILPLDSLAALAFRSVRAREN